MVGTEYGKALTTHHGRGTLELANGTRLLCRITICQTETGLVYIDCRFAAKLSEVTAIINSIMRSNVQELTSIFGKTTNGLSFKSVNHLYAVNATLGLSLKPSRLKLLAQEVDFWSEDKDKIDHVKFNVVNFEFTGNHATRRIDHDGSKSVEHLYRNLELRTPWGKVEIDQVPDYDSVVRKTIMQKGISVTCQIIVAPIADTRFEDIAKNVLELCRLLSLSRGTKINWISAEGCTAKGEICEIVLRHSITWPFSSGNLIDPRDPTDTATFIEKVYPVYLRLREEYNLDIAIEQYLDANNSTTYLETRGLAAVALIDSLQQLYTSKHNLAKIISGFSNKKEEIKDALASTISTIFPNIESQQLSDILEKLPELNRKPFRSLLQAWTESIGLNIPGSELTAFVQTRNSLAHNMSYLSRDSRGKQVEYFRLINFINQVFLKLLGYDGHFIYVDLNDLSHVRKKFN
jgi:hypothetical protein